jgi:hypothetical protein
MDIDNDGVLSFEDLHTFLSRLEYINNDNSAIYVNSSGGVNRKKNN